MLQVAVVFGPGTGSGRYGRAGTGVCRIERVDFGSIDVRPARSGDRIRWLNGGTEFS